MFIANRHAHAASANKPAGPVPGAAYIPCTAVHVVLPLASGDTPDSRVHSIRASHDVQDRSNGDVLPQN